MLQDFLAPQLRELTGRLDALEKVMDARFNALEAKIEGMQRNMDIRFKSLEDSLDLDRRLSKVEAAQKPSTTQ